MARLSEEQYRSFGTQILPELFLTSSYEAKDAAWLKKHRITHLVSVAEECPPSSALALKSLHIPLRDSPRTDVASHFAEVFDFIDAGRNSACCAVLECRICHRLSHAEGEVQSPPGLVSSEVCAQFCGDEYWLPQAVAGLGAQLVIFRPFSAAQRRSVP
ncbi:unnamed protein product [Cladocopium goreaui]|uniref:Rhodanese domain-containing dual specificity protein phosphatase n=1 Tax=Cladocopium goreaui TaxID=2562237 RepID=A0A9P1GNZ3_9DINO|nr:unnamed protein product [Cladocopium goreaui]